MFHACLVKYFKFEKVQKVSQTFFHNSSGLHLTKPYTSPSSTFKNAPVYSFVKNSNFVNKTKNRLFVWGYAGMGALGNLFQ
jgi:hypothetical protein